MVGHKVGQRVGKMMVSLSFVAAVFSLLPGRAFQQPAASKLPTEANMEI